MPKESSAPGQARILIVEDDPVNIELMKAQLGSEGYVIESVLDGEEALRRLSQTKPDLVLLDIMLPKKSGFEVCKLIKSNAEIRNTPVIMVTALNDMESRVKGIAVGADDFLTRPMDKSQLLARVKSMLRIKQLNDELTSETLASRESSEKLERQQRVLKSMSTQLMQASHLKYEFIVNMSHALRTPLNVIIGFSEMLQDELVGKLNDKQLKYVNNVHESGRELQQLITNIVDVFKIDTGKVPLETTEFSLKDSIVTAAEAMKAAVQEKKMDISVRVAPEASRICADPQKLAVILENLLSNAVKFSPRGSTVQVQAERVGDSIRLCVRDSGPGLSEVDCKRVFTEFYKVSHPEGSPSGGSGLGLAISKKLVLMHGGEIWAESKRGEGSAFIFTLPQRQKRAQW
ncbi:hybrid sensor histidine kinase/response regulator [Candidatus Poribacteria bacterium]|nr:hybrid sensor histidine kinase/response regulator [Candidatus Poribacteria bacterium]